MLMSVSMAGEHFMKMRTMRISLATRPSQTGNDRLKWEATEQVDLALDFGFLPNQRISGTLGFYKKKTDGFVVCLYYGVEYRPGDYTD